MPPRKVTTPEILNRLVEEWDIDFISPYQLRDAISAMREATVGLADDINPTCLVAATMDIRASGPSPHKPVSCGQHSYPDNHSITENGVLSKIADKTSAGEQVLKFFPTASNLANQLRGSGGYPGSEFAWNIERVFPERVAISLASIGHFACEWHDSGVVLGKADKVQFPDRDAYFSISGHNPPIEFMELADALHQLAYRTLLFRISQFRGTELVAAKKIQEQIRAENRFLVDSMRDHLKELGSVALPLYRHKSQFDQYVVEFANLPLVHHIAPFKPIVRYAFSEYQPFKFPQSRSRKEANDIYAAANVIPDDNVTWYVLSHPASYDAYDTSRFKNHVLDFTATAPDKRRAFDLGSLSGLTNIYASPTDYFSLPEDDRVEVERRLAKALCEAPHEKSLAFLEATPAGAKLINRIRADIRKSRNT